VTGPAHPIPSPAARAAAVAVSVLSLLSGCGSCASSPPQEPDGGAQRLRVRVTGTVVDRGEQPIAGAIATLGDHRVATSGSGRFSLVAAPAEGAVIVVSADGYLDAERPLQATGLAVDIGAVMLAKDQLHARVDGAAGGSVGDAALAVDVPCEDKIKWSLNGKCSVWCIILKN